MAWTVITDATLEVGKALRALTMRNLRDNIAAMAAGDAGAPQIQTAAIAAGVVTNAKMAAGSVAAGNIIDGNVTSAKLATGANEVNWVLARTGGATTGALGTYAFLRKTTTGTIGFVAGTNYTSLSYSGLSQSSGGVTDIDTSGGAAGGTWKCMGATDNGNPMHATLFLRIA